MVTNYTLVLGFTYCFIDDNNIFVVEYFCVQCIVDK